MGSVHKDVVVHVLQLAIVIVQLLSFGVGNDKLLQVLVVSVGLLNLELSATFIVRFDVHCVQVSSFFKLDFLSKLHMELRPGIFPV